MMMIMMKSPQDNLDDDVSTRQWWCHLQLKGGSCIYQEVGGRRNGDAVVEQLPCVVVHGSTAFHRLTHTNADTHTHKRNALVSTLAGRCLSPLMKRWKLICVQINSKSNCGFNIWITCRHITTLCVMELNVFQPPSPHELRPPPSLTRWAAVQVWFMAAVSTVPPPQGRCCGGSLCVWPWHCTYTAAHHSSGPKTDTGDTDRERRREREQKKKSDNSATCANEAARCWQQEVDLLRDISQTFTVSELQLFSPIRQTIQLNWIYWITSKIISKE